ncbi:MAG: hypothetical protein UR87_C0012G0017 [candidate division CPR3 bacterium GW2011_GWE2_35_7]|uniref:Uncharacterized protein n=1 Tax=candidate division CPR3 bacterium GW2011_GWF2_35_18 TaxID=1618350 RepID=A0A0G0BL71_UNCC3|nr:MAG: hypothetical protein UR67_C0001G0067 [candidate division CPR3 bacterium GW2011_GWF2_35_18]KKP86725.1 MAG: hypothetical protein UR87_C0012G0017 [candidate division CPR3 bacterium GW2011_GWE2_35_7]
MYEFRIKYRILFAPTNLVNPAKKPIKNPLFPHFERRCFVNRKRNSDEVLKDRATILHHVLLCPGQTTRGIASSYASQVRSTSQTRDDLQFLEKIGLVSSNRLDSGVFWCPVNSGVQRSLFGGASVIPYGNRKSNGNIPSIRELRQKIISLTEKDLRREWWVSKAKREFQCDLESAGGRVSWQEADDVLTHWRGGWKPAQMKLFQGRGTITNWGCGCRRIIPWNGKTAWFDCPQDGACERAVAYDRACGKNIKHKNGQKGNGYRRFEQTLAIPVLLQLRKPMNPKTPISIDSCWRVDLHPPKSCDVGEFYSAPCGCQFHVSQSTDGALMGVIRFDRGLVCSRHAEEVAVSQE